MRCDKKYSGDAMLMRSHFTREINIGLIMFGAERSTWGPSEGELSEKIKVPVNGAKGHGNDFRPRRQGVASRVWQKLSDRISEHGANCRPNAISITAPSPSPSKIEIYEINFPGISQFLSLNLKRRKWIKMCWLLYDVEWDGSGVK